jgi:hypothetical protein
MTDYLLIILSTAVVAHAMWARYQDGRVKELSDRIDALESAVRNLTGDGR